MFLFRVVFIFCTLFAVNLSALQVQQEHLLWDANANMDSMPGSIVELDGEILAVWYGGDGKGACNYDMKEVGMWQSRFSNGAWSKPECIFLDKDARSWNPVYMKTKDELVVYFRAGNQIQDAASMMMRSKDGGKTYSKPERLAAGVNGPTKSSPMILDDGTWLFPSSVSRCTNSDNYRTSAVWLEISSDGGKSFQKYGPVVDPEKPFGLTEPCIYKDANGNVRLFCRNRAHKIGEIGHIWSATFFTKDKRLGDIHKTPLANPDSGIACVKLQNGQVALVHNDSLTDRTPLVVSISFDDGKTFTKTIVLEDGPGEFSQPTIIQASDGSVHIFYAYKPAQNERKNLKHVILE